MYNSHYHQVNNHCAYIGFSQVKDLLYTLSVTFLATEYGLHCPDRSHTVIRFAFNRFLWSLSSKLKASSRQTCSSLARNRKWFTRSVASIACLISFVIILKSSSGREMNMLHSCGRRKSNRRVGVFWMLYFLLWIASWWHENDDFLGANPRKVARKCRLSEWGSCLWNLRDPSRGQRLRWLRSVAESEKYKSEQIFLYNSNILNSNSKQCKIITAQLYVSRY